MPSKKDVKRMSLFRSPMLLGFDQLEELLESASRLPAEGYPPYNIEQTGTTGLRISLAIAGFTANQLDIEHCGKELVVRGRQSEDNKDTTDYLHRGIAARQFVKKFILADGMTVQDAFLENGLLHIDISKPNPDTQVRKIPVRCT